MADAFVVADLARGPRRFVIRFEGADKTFTVNGDRIEAQLVSEMSPALRDLLEISASVFAADSEFPRGGGTRPNMGEAWARNFRFTIPVRRPDIWGRPAVRDALIDAVQFLTDDRVEFRFAQKDADVPRPIKFFPFETTESLFHAREVILFSGCLDSFSGALEALATGDGNVVLVTHRSAQKVIPRQVGLAEYLKKRFPDRVLHIQVQAVRKGQESRESTQRSRSLLFAALGYTVARMLGAVRVSFYENGVVSQNLPISPQVIGTMATRTTHPLALRKLEQLLHLIGEGAIPLRNEYEWLTKREVVEKIAQHGAADQITRAVSCTKVRDQDAIRTHCRSCSQCLDRRFAILAAGLAAHDDEMHYETDVLSGARVSDASRTMGLDWTRHAWRLGDLSLQDFYTAFASDLSRIAAGHPELGPGEVVRRSHALQQRHSESVRRVFRAAAAKVLEPTLPPTALLRMFLAERVVPTDPLPVPEVEAKSHLQAGPRSVDGIGFRPEHLEVIFSHVGNRHIVEILRLGSVAGSPAAVAHALKPQYERDRCECLAAHNHRYVLPRDLDLPGYPSKGSIHANVSRLRRQFAAFYEALMGEPLPDQFLVQNRKSCGYRLDPDIRIVAEDQRPRTGHKRQ